MLSLFLNLSASNFEKHLFFFIRSSFSVKPLGYNKLFFLYRFKKFFLGLTFLPATIINKDFYHLILKKWVFLVDNITIYFFLYNYFMFKLLYQTCSLILFLMQRKKDVLFITDDDLENIISFRDLNYVALPKDLRHLSYILGDYRLWTRESKFRARSNFLLKSIRRKRFDLLVILCVNYSSLKPVDFLGVSRISLGFADLQTRPSLFNYFLPVVKNKFFSAQILKEFLFFFNK